MQGNILYGCKQSDVINDLSNNVPYGRYSDRQLTHLEAQVEAGLIGTAYDQELCDHLVNRTYHNSGGETVIYSKEDHDFNITLGVAPELDQDDIREFLVMGLTDDSRITQAIIGANECMPVNVVCDEIYQTTYHAFMEKVVITGIRHGGRNYPVHVGWLFDEVVDGKVHYIEANHIFPVSFTKNPSGSVNIVSHLSGNPHPLSNYWGAINVSMSPRAWIKAHLRSRFSTLGNDRYDIPVIPSQGHVVTRAPGGDDRTVINELVTKINNAISSPFRVNGPLHHIWSNLAEFNGDDTVYPESVLFGTDASGVIFPDDHMYIREMTDTVVSFDDHSFDLRVVVMWDGSEGLVIDVKDPYRYNSGGPEFILTGKVVERVVYAVNSRLGARGCSVQNVVRKVYNPGVTGRGYSRPGLDINPVSPYRTKGLILLGPVTDSGAGGSYTTEQINSILEALEDVG